MKKLKKCPFCNGKPQIMEAMNGHSYVECNRCYSRTMELVYENEAIDAWNYFVEGFNIIDVNGTKLFFNKLRNIIKNFDSFIIEQEMVENTK